MTTRPHTLMLIALLWLSLLGCDDGDDKRLEERRARAAQQARARQAQEAAELKQLQAAVEEARAQRAKTRAAFPGSPDTSALLDQVDKLAKLHQIQVLHFKPVARKKGRKKKGDGDALGGLEEIPIQVSLQGGYSALVDTLADIASLERPTAFTGLQLKPRDEKAPGGPLLVSGQLLTWWRPDAPAEAPAGSPAAQQAQALKRELQAIEDDLGRLTRLRREGGQAAELLAELASLLTQPESTRARREREALGWDVDWDPRRLWFSQLSQKGEQLTIRGGAHTHSDVAEFLKRVDRSPKTRAAQLGATQQGADGRVAYTIQATLAPREAGQE